MSSPTFHSLRRRPTFLFVLGTVILWLSSAIMSAQTCTPTAITPFLQVNSGSWQSTASVTVNSGDTVKFGPQPITGGSWSWSGPNGFNLTSREVTVTANSSANYTAAFLNPAGCKSTQIFMLTVSAASSGANVLTQHNDNSRTGVNPNESILTPANVNVNGFGMLFKVRVDDQIFAQPLYLSAFKIAGGTHNVFIVATTANSVYAFDADNGTQYWHVNLGNAFQVSDGGFNCSDILKTMGIMATPVIDPGRQTLYVVARTNESGSFFHRLHALDLTSGAERAGSPVHVTTSGFDSKWQNQRPGLLLSQGNIYIAVGSNCDDPPYKGYVFGYNAGTLGQVGVLNASPDDTGSAIWQSGNGLSTDAAGNIYLVTGNGTWDGVRNFSESALKVSPSLNILDWFTPSSHASLDAGDLDLNTSGALLIPGSNVMVAAGKDGIMDVLNTANMGHLGDTSAVQKFQFASSHVHSLVYWNGRIYVWGQADNMKVYQFNGSTFNTTPVQTRSEVAMGHPGASLSISSNGSTNGILWASTNLTGGSFLGAWHDTQPGILLAYDASNVSHELWNSYQAATRDDCNNYAKFTAPTIANGKVYLASFGTAHTQSGQVCVYGLNPPAGSVSTPLPNGVYTIANISSGQVWDDPGSATTAGTNVVLWSANGGANQKWTVTSVGNGFYTIRNQASGLVLDDPNSSIAPGTQLVQWTSNGGSNQQWLVTQVGNGYTIVNQASGLSADPGGNTQGTNIRQAAGSGAATQLWSIK